MTYQRAPERFANLFHTDVEAQTVWVQEGLGLKTMSKVDTVARARLRPGYVIIRVPHAQLRRIVATRRAKESKYAPVVNASGKPTPPSRNQGAQLTNQERRKRYGLGFAPMSAWWPKS